MNLALQMLLCLLAADLLSGLFHWFEDTYLVVGDIAWLNERVTVPNLRHHEYPGSMHGSSWLELNALGVVLTATIAAGAWLSGCHAWEIYASLAMASHANQTHHWAHCSKRPEVVRWLQRLGLLLSIRHHALHHKRPQMVNYCVMTDLLNPLLDWLKFWRGLEFVISCAGIQVKRRNGNHIIGPQ